MKNTIKQNKQQTCIHNKYILQREINTRNFSQVGSPFVSFGLETECAYSQKIDKEVNLNKDKVSRQVK